MGTHFEKATHYPIREPQPSPPGQTPPKGKKRRLLILFTGLIFVAMAVNWADLIEWKDGQLQLKRARAAQLEQDLKEIDDAEQYALLAKEPGFYPCLLCPNKMIFLNEGEVWKYGVTRKGQRLRYSDKFFQNNNLYYFVEFNGHYAACLAIEKIKLYNYPLLPENVARPDPFKLPFPPGNQQTK